MPDSPSLSIVSPSYNLGTYIAETIDSVIAQDLESVEMIVADGGSDDNTLGILLAYEACLNLKWISEPDQGLYDALNKAIAVTSAPWIGWINCDDIYPGGTFDAVLNAIAENPEAEIICGDAEVFSRDSTHNERVLYVNEHYRGDYFEASEDHLRICHLNACFFRRDLLERIGTFRTDFRIAADRDFMFRLMSARPRSIHVGRVTCRYRAHENSLTMSDVSVEQCAPLSGSNIRVTDELRRLCDLYVSSRDVPAAVRKWCRTVRARHCMRDAAAALHAKQWGSFLHCVGHGLRLRPRSILWLAGYVVRAQAGVRGDNGT